MPEESYEVNGGSISTGVDIVLIARIRRLSREPLFLKRVFTEGELTYSLARRRSYRYLAGFFAAKEAVMKALKTGWGSGVGWQDIEVVAGKGNGDYRVKLHSRALEFSRGGKVFLSLSFSEDVAVAFAVVD